MSEHRYWDTDKQKWVYPGDADYVAFPESPATAIRNGSVADIPDEELLRRAVATARSRYHRKGLGHPRWVAVMDAFMLGSTYASQLCIRFGLDPEEQVKR